MKRKILSTNNSLRQNIAQIGTAFLAVLLCLMSVWIFAGSILPETEDIPYPLEGYVANYDPYVQQFDAWKKGQNHIDWEAEPGLAELDNVYDYAERTASGLYYLWDRAYYDGKFYSYFGIAPVITVYEPYYALHGALPGSGTVMRIFVTLAAVFMPLALFAWARVFAPETKHYLLLFAGPAVFFGSCILMIARGYTPFYFIACVSALAFLSMFLFFAIVAYGQRRLWARCVMYAVAGVCFGLLFQARVITAVAAAILVVPGLWFFLIGRERSARGRKRWKPVLLELGSLGLPVLLFFIGAFIFNAQRFSGPLDFGNNYNLTIADVSTYRFRLSDFPFAMYHYWFDIPNASEIYPYATFSYVRFSDYGHYLYRDAGLGLCVVPLASAVFASPAVVFSKSYTPRRRVFTACGLLAVLLIPLADFCLGGVIYRYLSDFSLIAVFFGAVTLLSLCNTFQSKKTPARTALTVCLYLLAAAFLLWSIAASVRYSLINDNGNVLKYSEETASQLQKWLPFAAKGVTP